MIYLLGILISLTAGFLLIRLLTSGRLNLILHLLFALVLGLGLDGTVTFYIQILFNQFDRWIPIGIIIIGIGLLSYTAYNGASKTHLKNLKKTKIKSTPDLKQKLSLISQIFLPTADNIKFTQAHLGGLLVLLILLVPLLVTANYFPLGGWDAWSCWNLKTKFIFLGHENWKDVLAPGLWRSNTQYPLLLPLVNVWFCDLIGKFDQAIPMINSIIIAILTASILLFGLLELTGFWWASLLAVIAVIAIPTGITLFTSQYSDSLVGLFLLSAFTCLLLADKYDLPKLKVLSMVFLGLMSFTKNEGLVAAGIVALLIFWKERSNKNELKNLIIAFFIAALPTIIFTLTIAPKNEAFINGLTSTVKPTDWTRLKIVLAFSVFQFISSSWNGFWIIAFGGILLAGKRLWRSTLGIIGISLVLYLGVVLVNYAVNTFFDILWWLAQTLSRILFALLPTVALWLGVGLTKK